MSERAWLANRIEGSVVLVTLALAARSTLIKIISPIIGFILDPKGLMYNLTLEGSKISRISR
jgi:hypothetical protein